jgi:hypothetical protein
MSFTFVGEDEWANATDVKLGRLGVSLSTDEEIASSNNIDGKPTSSQSQRLLQTGVSYGR